jgi:hypothetical protein
VDNRNRDGWVIMALLSKAATFREETCPHPSLFLSKPAKLVT